MIYFRRRDDERRQRKKSPVEVKQWRKIEEHVRRKLGFKQGRRQLKPDDREKLDKIVKYARMHIGFEFFFFI